MLHFLGYLIGTNSTLPNEKNKKGIKITPFSNFFTWCQMCRHGGHADHISKWFEEHRECPVYSCTCKCADLDIDPTNDTPPSRKNNENHDDGDLDLNQLSISTPVTTITKSS